MSSERPIHDVVGKNARWTPKPRPRKVYPSSKTACVVCRHHDRALIDQRIIAEGASASICADYGLSRRALWTHWYHSPEILNQRHQDKKDDRGLVRSALQHATWLVMRLRELAQKSRSPQELLEAAVVLNRAITTYGRLTGEIRSTHIQNLFVTLGVKDQSELEAAVSQWKSASQVSLEQSRDAAVECLCLILKEKPEWKSEVLDAILAGRPMHAALPVAASSVEVLDQGDSLWPEPTPPKLLESPTVPSNGAPPPSRTSSADSLQPLEAR